MRQIFGRAATVALLAAGVAAVAAVEAKTLR